jgi:hypothetical protein
MFICVGETKRRLHMSMTSVYSEEHMYDRAVPFLFAEHVTHVIHTLDGTIQQVRLGPGVFLEFAPACFTRVESEAELRFACRAVTLFHDHLRSESEQLSIDENEWSQHETELLEEIVAYRMLEPDSCDSDTDSCNGEDSRTTA